MSRWRTCRWFNYETEGMICILFKVVSFEYGLHLSYRGIRDLTSYLTVLDVQGPA